MGREVRSTAVDISKKPGLILVQNKELPGDERAVPGHFLAVARFGSLNAAARHLGLSSASVGEQIKVLEKDLNARLVARQAAVSR